MSPQPVPPVPYPPGASRPTSVASSIISPPPPLYSGSTLLSKVLEQRKVQCADQLFSVSDYEIITELVTNISSSKSTIETILALVLGFNQAYFQRSSLCRQLQRPECCGACTFKNYFSYSRILLYGNLCSSIGRRLGFLSSSQNVHSYRQRPIKRFSALQNRFRDPQQPILG